MTWTMERIERVFLEYMEEHGHAVIEGHSVRSPTEDVLFTTAGMHPLVPYLYGETPHPDGDRLANVQRCVRTTDINEVGDDTHLTVFEMLGNWSIGDYFKKTSISQSFELLTDGFEIDPESLYVTVFEGDDATPADTDSIAIWETIFRSAGVDSAGRITPLGADDNWWSNGPVGLCGPDTEIFVHVGEGQAPPFADRPEFVEIWNNVFMTFDRHDDGSLDVLDQHNVDTGMGLERLAMFLGGHRSVWEIDELALLLEVVGDALGVDPSALDDTSTRSLRIVTDHLRAALVIAAAGVRPAASRRGYVLRKLTRRAVRYAELLHNTEDSLDEAIISAIDAVSEVIGRRWHDIGQGDAGSVARETVVKETKKFARTLRNGVEYLHEEGGSVFDGDLAFRLADSLGYPAELAAEEAERIGMAIDPEWERRYVELREAQRARSRN